jgi:chromosome condensin MukBEF MukE localization factor
MSTIQINEQVFFGKNGKPKSVLLDYKVYTDMIELIEDAKCVKVIQKRENESTISEADFKKKLKLV